MNWTVFFIISLSCLLSAVAAAIILAKTKYKRGRILDPTTIIFAGVVVSAVILFIPVCISTYREKNLGGFETVMVSIHNMLRLFVVDGEFTQVTTNLQDITPTMFRCYTALFSVLFVTAPVLTFGFVLSFFKNTSAYYRFMTHFWTDTFIFSELNEKSLTLAASLYENKDKKRFFVFTDVYEKEDAFSKELVERAKELGAVYFENDILVNNFAFHSKKKDLYFFMIGDDQSKNISQGLKIIERYQYRENSHLYVFSNQVESELLLTNAFNNEQANADGKKSQIKVRRVNEVRSLIYRTLYEDGFQKIFSTAHEEDGIKHIHAIVIGMGQHGVEMTKALSWFCQMDGYQAKISCFDKDKKADEKFISLCPETMDPRLNGHFDIPGESRNDITVYPNMDVDSLEFDKLFQSLPRSTYIFVALGNDEKNISIAVKLRMLAARMGHTPAIHAVIYNTEKKEALTGIVNFKNQPYDINFIGDMKSSCSENVILGSDIEALALQRHIKWGSENHFWQYDYNYKSSIASAIHRQMKILCKIPGSDKDPKDRTEEELWGMRILEHCRWNAYMRSEGYVFSEKRYDLAKTHHCLIPFADLPLAEQIKDDD